jgi:hypothetical protein
VNITDEEPHLGDLVVGSHITDWHTAIIALPGGEAANPIMVELEATLTRLTAAFKKAVRPIDTLIRDIERRVREIGKLYQDMRGLSEHGTKLLLTEVGKLAKTLQRKLGDNAELVNELLVLLSKLKIEEAIDKAVAPIKVRRAEHEAECSHRASQAQAAASAQLETLHAQLERRSSPPQASAPVPVAPLTARTGLRPEPPQPAPPALPAWEVVQPIEDDETPDIDRGRLSRPRPTSRSPRRPTRRTRRRRTILACAGMVVIAVIAAIVMSSGPSWPPVVLHVQNEVKVACGQANTSANGVTFACDSQTQQILWVMSLVTSAGNANYNGNRWSALVSVNSPKAAKIRVGLEPIYTVEGAQLYQLLLKSMQMPEPYNPLNPSQSILVAAQAINNMIAGGYGVDPRTGGPKVFPGFMQYRKACLAYTGSAAQIWRDGLPECKKPIEQSGYPALVRDIATQWIPGGKAALVKDVLILFEHASDPGNPQVRSVLKQLQLLN